jgi:hypothetical protein
MQAATVCLFLLSFSNISYHTLEATRSVFQSLGLCPFKEKRKERKIFGYQARALLKKISVAAEHYCVGWP